MLSDKPWPPDQVLQLLMRLLVSYFVGILLVSLIHSGNWVGAEQQRLLTLAISTLSFHGMALILTNAFLRDQGISWAQAFGLLSPGLGRALGLALLASIAVIPIALSLGHLSAKVMNLVHLQPMSQEHVQMLQSGTTLPVKWAMGFLAIIVAPFAEELVFRGLIYPTLKQNGLPRVALWGTSLLFALIHTNLMILLPLTFLAVVLTLLYESTDNLLAPIFAHSLFNLFNFFWLVTQPSAPAVS